MKIPDIQHYAINTFIVPSSFGWAEIDFPKVMNKLLKTVVCLEDEPSKVERGSNFTESAFQAHIVHATTASNMSKTGSR